MRRWFVYGTVVALVVSTLGMWHVRAPAVMAKACQIVWTGRGPLAPQQSAAFQIVAGPGQEVGLWGSTDASTNQHWRVRILDQNGVEVVVREIYTDWWWMGGTVPAQSQSRWTVEATNLMDQTHIFEGSVAICPGGVSG